MSTEFLSELSLNFGAQGAAPGCEHLHNAFNLLRFLGSCISDCSLVDLRGKHGPRTVLVLCHTDYTTWQMIRGVVIQAANLDRRQFPFMSSDGGFMCRRGLLR